MTPVQITQHTKKLIILDIDGCAIDSDERLPHLIHHNDRPAYDAAHATDKTYPAGHFMYNLLVTHDDCTVLFVTGRRECAREYTLAQLNHALGSNVEIKDWQLLMRPLGCDDVHDTVLKPRMIEDAGYKLEDILLVIEDRDSTVAMWRERGITCWQTQLGSF